MADFATRRKFMVDTQIRTADVTRFPIITAMLSVPREDFVPAARAEAAYVGENVPLAPGRVVLEPRTLAKMLDALEFTGDELVLDIGCGLGYSAAVMSRMAATVVALEEDPDLLAEAPQVLADCGADNVVLEQGALADGAAALGPYDVIVLQGAAEQVPEAILAQLKEGGRIICPFMEGHLGVVRIGRNLSGRVNWRYAFNASAPVLPGFERARSFAFS